MGNFFITIFFFSLLVLSTLTNLLIGMHTAFAGSIIRTTSTRLSALPVLGVLHPLRDTNLHTNVLPAATTANLGYVPSDIKKAYNLPVTGGSGTIAIVTAFYAPTAENDLNTFSNRFNLPLCTTANGCFQVHFENGSPPAQNSQWQAETDLDIEWAHAIAPNAKILVVEVNSDTDIADFIAGVDYARSQPNVVAVSMSWGTREFSNESSYDSYFTSQSGVAFFAASGDQGHGILWPAASSNVIGVGGTTLILGSNTVTETAWRGSSGGISLVEAEAGYQSSFPIPNAQGKRGVPDVSAVADQSTGVLMYAPDGWHLVGGTSVATPIWSGIRALTGNPVTHDLLYQNAKTNYGKFYRDITSGTNGLCSIYCSATTGYDYITGLGSPIALPAGIAPTSGTTPPPISSTPIPTSLPPCIQQNFQTANVAVPIKTIPFPLPSNPLLSLFPRISIRPSPTFRPVATPTPTPLPPTPPCIPTTPTGTIPPPNPSGTPNPTPGNTTASIALHFEGIDQNNNTSPKNLQRKVTLYFFTNNNFHSNPTATATDFVDFFRGSDFASNAEFAIQSVPTGDYYILAKSPEGSLRELVTPQKVHIDANQNNTIIDLLNPNTTVPFLRMGDLNNDNVVDTTDYNILVDCFGEKQTSTSCTSHTNSRDTTKGLFADLNDDGVVDGIDYNILIRHFAETGY